MSIAHELGLDTLDPQQLAISRWQCWATRHPALYAVEPEHLEEWLGRTADPDATAAQYAEVDGVLRGLARLAARDDGDDTDAAHVLAWVMLPAAIAVARSVHTPAATIDQLVASHLWILARTFRWRTRPGSVAANIARDLRALVMLDLGIARPRRHLSLAPTDPIQLDLVPDLRVVSVSPDDELRELLAQGCATGAITDSDRVLLDCLLEVVRRRNAPPMKSSASGLLSASVTLEVAGELGMSSRHVRRRASAAMTSLARMARDIA